MYKILEKRLLMINNSLYLYSFVMREKIISQETERERKKCVTDYTGRQRDWKSN